MMKVGHITPGPDKSQPPLVQAAVSAIAAQGWMQNTEAQKTINISANELTSLSALIAYVASNTGENEFRVERRVSDRFNIANVSCLPADQFDTAIRYLVDGE